MSDPTRRKKHLQAAKAALKRSSDMFGQLMCGEIYE